MGIFGTNVRKRGAERITSTLPRVCKYLFHAVRTRKFSKPRATVRDIRRLKSMPRVNQEIFVIQTMPIAKRWRDKLTPRARLTWESGFGVTSVAGKPCAPAGRKSPPPGLDATSSYCRM